MFNLTTPHLLYTKKLKPFNFTEKLCIVLCVCRYRWGQSYTVMLFVSCFDCPCFSSDYEMSDANSAHPQFQPPTLLLSFNYEKAVKRKAAVLRTEWVDSATAAFRCLELFVYQMHSISAVQLPSRSSCPKLVPCWERVPPRSTTASSSFLCRTQTHIQHYNYYSRAQSCII